MAEPMKTISIKLPAALDRKLSRLAREQGASRSAVLREALQSYEGRIGRSFAQEAGDLAGSLSGPRDLSTSDEYMSDYGK